MIAVVAVLLAGVAYSAYLHAVEARKHAEKEHDDAERARLSAELLAQQARETQQAIESELRKNVDRAQTKCDAAKQAKQEADSKAVRARKEADDAQQKIEEAQGRGATAWTVKLLRDDARRKKESADRLEAQARDASRREAEARQEATAAADALKQKDSIIGSLQQSLAKLRDAAARKDDELKKLREKVEGLAQENADLKEKNVSLTQERDTLRARRRRRRRLLGRGPAARIPTTER
jgi:chromosome segregation ATPase